MNIIFSDSKEDLPDNYTVLELDQFRVAGSEKVLTAFCVVENIPLGDFPVLDAYVKVHHDLMIQYRLRNWEYCLNAIKGLTGKWNGELDSFYSNLAERVNSYVELPPDETWDGVLER